MCIVCNFKCQLSFNWNINNVCTTQSCSLTRIQCSHTTNSCHLIVIVKVINSVLSLWMGLWLCSGESTGWSVFSYIMHFHLQRCFQFIILHFSCVESQTRQQLTKIKRHFFIGQRPFDSRLYLDISRSFKCPKCSPVVCLICYYLRSVR